MGFNISPILWTKLPGSKSAGRVQSVALKLITEREHEIESFKPEEYWTIDASFKNSKDKNILSKLNLINDKKVERFSFKNKSDVLKNGIEIGSPVTYAPYYKQLSNNNVCGSSLDDRAGCVVILNVAISLMKLKKRPTVHIVFSVQEEFNLRGVLPVINSLKPEIAIRRLSVDKARNALKMILEDLILRAQSQYYQLQNLLKNKEQIY